MKIFTKHPRHAGFTILELMVATVTFSVILLIIAAAILRITDNYIKGTTSANTQAVARSIMSDVSQAVQFDPDQVQLTPPSGGNTVGVLCASGNAYSYEMGKEVISGQHGLIKDQGGNCSDPTMTFTATSHELLADRMRLAAFEVNCSFGGANQCLVQLTVISGEDDMMSAPSGSDWSDVHCLDGPGSQFCAVSTLTSVVQQRVRQ